MNNNDNLSPFTSSPFFDSVFHGRTSDFPKKAHEELLKLYADEIVPGPLNGMVVFSMEQQICGPLASRLLAEKGALVIKAEPPQGDSKRRNSTTNTFGTFNVGKKSIVLSRDVQSDRLKLYLLAAADVVIDNRSKTARAQDRALKQFQSMPHESPKIYAVISGYGKDNDRIAYDRSIQADAGYIDLNDGKAIPNSPTDMMTGAMTVGEITSYWSWVARLNEEDKTWLKNQHRNLIVCDVPMINVAIFNTMNQAMTVRDTGDKESSIVPYGHFHSKDGKFGVAIGTDEQFAAFCQSLGIGEYAERYPTNEARRKHRDLIDESINAIMRTRTNAEWMDFFAGKPLAYAPVSTFREAIERNRHLLKVPSNGRHPYVTTGISTNIFPTRPLTSPPALGEHTGRIIEKLARLDMETGMSKSA